MATIRHAVIQVKTNIAYYYYFPAPTPTFGFGGGCDPTNLNRRLARKKAPPHPVMTINQINPLNIIIHIFEEYYRYLVLTVSKYGGIQCYYGYDTLSAMWWPLGFCSSFGQFEIKIFVNE